MDNDNNEIINEELYEKISNKNKKIYEQLIEEKKMILELKNEISKIIPARKSISGINFKSPKVRLLSLVTVLFIIAVIITINFYQKSTYSRNDYIKFYKENNLFLQRDLNPNPNQLRAVVRLNVYRSYIGLSSLTLNPALNKASMKHVKYVVLHRNEQGFNLYKETPGKNGFTGITHIERAKNLGYPHPGVFELVTFAGFPDTAIDNWMSTLYSRLPLTQPEAFEVGYARSSRLDFLLISAPLVINKLKYCVYPGENMISVPRRCQKEYPAPHIKGIYAGQPITIQFQSKVPILKNIEVIEHSLVDRFGRPVPYTLITPKTDRNKLLRNAVCIFPNSWLLPFMKYTVRIKIKLNDIGQTIEKNWSFTTGR